MSTNKIAVFNLPENVREREIEDMFGKYGRIDRIAVRNTRAGDLMSFVEFYDSRDAADAQRARHGYSFDGRSLRVELSGEGKSEGKSVGKGRGGKGGRDRDDSRQRGRGRRDDSRGGGRGGNRGGKGYDNRQSRGPGMGYQDYKGKGKGGPRSPQRLKDHWFKVRVTGLPPSASWQDLKDFLRGGGHVKFTEVKKEEGELVGYGGFETKDDCFDVVDKCDGKEFKARDGEVMTVSCQFDPSSGPAQGGSSGSDREDRADRSRSRSRAPSRRSAQEPRSRSRSGSRKSN